MFAAVFAMISSGVSACRTAAKSTNFHMLGQTVIDSESFPIDHEPPDV